MAEADVFDIELQHNGQKNNSDSDEEPLEIEEVTVLIVPYQSCVIARLTAYFNVCPPVLHFYFRLKTSC